MESCIIEHMFDTVELAAVDPHADQAALIEQIAWLERVKSAATAGQARAAAALDAKRRAAEAAAGVPTAKQGRGVAGEVALARRDSPARGGRHLGLAKALVHEMPHTLAALESGALSEWRATLIARESACLDVEDRRRLDAELCANVDKLEGMGDARIVAAAKEIAARLDAQAVVDRAAKAEADRTVTIRPAPDCMTYVTALLPVANGVGVYAALNKHCRGDALDCTACEPRSTPESATTTPAKGSACNASSTTASRSPTGWAGKLSPATTTTTSARTTARPGQVSRPCSTR